MVARSEHPVEKRVETQSQASGRSFHQGVAKGAPIESTFSSCRPCSFAYRLGCHRRLQKETAATAGSNSATGSSSAYGYNHGHALAGVRG